VADDCAGVPEHISEAVHLVHIFERAGPVACDKEVIAVGEAEAFADVFKSIGEGPADADGFFGECEDAFFGFVERIFGVDPGDLVLGEVAH